MSIKNKKYIYILLIIITVPVIMYLLFLNNKKEIQKTSPDVIQSIESSSLSGDSINKIDKVDTSVFTLSNNYSALMYKSKDDKDIIDNISKSLNLTQGTEYPKENKTVKSSNDLEMTYYSITHQITVFLNKGSFIIPVKGNNQAYLTELEKLVLLSQDTLFVKNTYNDTDGKGYRLDIGYKINGAEVTLGDYNEPIMRIAVDSTKGITSIVYYTVNVEKNSEVNLLSKDKLLKIPYDKWIFYSNKIASTKENISKIDQGDSLPATAYIDGTIKLLSGDITYIRNFTAPDYLIPYYSVTAEFNFNDGVKITGRILIPAIDTGS
jgi:hypothetical protein